ncbi:hypothetical protein SAMN04488503_2561 [Humidesulfovibrio mexicanus]|uniref:Thiamine biosynthesis protein ApbE n=1 Tax=Humidesulfovibrio mexicanus TaxID=147047 RepID=A0A239BHX9_9BACT|nr:UPF0280 family protein [Humidesulfovibrio mexicanus]SNS07011.1 hypothetical protein SAMN04488503_2561 [Humidesulfovibrio mexicanus]
MSRQAFLSAHRAYRESVLAQPGERRFQVVLEQTDLMVTAETDLSGPMLDMARVLRGELKNYMLTHPGFRESLVPFPVQDDAPEIVREMARASALANVGPMAAVAGTIAQLLAERFAPLSPNLIVENGGDIFMRSTRKRTVALLGDPQSGARLGLALSPRDFPVSLCASSATIGHSLSLGKGELVVVRSRSAALADAAATALANLIDTADDLDLLLARARKMGSLGVEGVFAQAGGRLGVWGKMELVALDGEG